MKNACELHVLQIEKQVMYFVPENILRQYASQADKATKTWKLHPNSICRMPMGNCRKRHCMVSPISKKVAQDVPPFLPKHET